MAKRKTKPTTGLTTGNSVPSGPTSLFGDIRQLIETARQQTARAINSALVGMYWHIGDGFARMC